MVKEVDKNSEWYNRTGQQLSWKHLPDTDEQTLFMRVVLDFWANPGKTGAASTGSSPIDPLFWTWHGLFDKTTHVVLLAPKYSNYRYQQL